MKQTLEEEILAIAQAVNAATNTDEIGASNPQWEISLWSRFPLARWQP